MFSVCHSYVAFDASTYPASPAPVGEQPTSVFRARLLLRAARQVLGVCRFDSVNNNHIAVSTK